VSDGIIRFGYPRKRAHAGSGISREFKKVERAIYRIDANKPRVRRSAEFGNGRDKPDGT